MVLVELVFSFLFIQDFFSDPFVMGVEAWRSDL